MLKKYFYSIYFNHVYREWNCEVDQLSKMGLNSAQGERNVTWEENGKTNIISLIHFDDSNVDFVQLQCCL